MLTGFGMQGTNVYLPLFAVEELGFSLVLGGMAWGAWRGIVWQLASLASLVLGYTVAHTTSDDLAVHFPGEPVVARGLAMVVIYAAVSAGFKLYIVD